MVYNLTSNIIGNELIILMWGNINHIENIFCEDLPILNLEAQRKRRCFNLILSNFKRNKTRKKPYVWTV